MLPEKFCERMQKLLGSEEAAMLFAQLEHGQRRQGLRVNTLKAGPDTLRQGLPFALQPVPWCPEGFYYSEAERPGLHPWHDAGLFYIQEPSAMAVGALASPKPGELVLDLCAAPGGKSTHLAAQMEGRGFLLCNEIHPARAKILSQNVERMGICNAAVSNESPARLAERLPGYFDRVVVDAPCSGEGMFRKNPVAQEEWSVDNISLCAGRQDEILDQAALLLRPGGNLVYSTCTFAPEEDEGSIQRFLQRHDFELEDACFHPLFHRGRPDWICGGDELRQCARLWPHRLEGDGHFMALLRKKDGVERSAAPEQAFIEAPREWDAFADATLGGWRNERLLRFGNELYQAPEGMIPLGGLRVLRPGLHLGTLRKNRLEPAHALALALRPGSAPGIDCQVGSQEVAAYLRGETIEAQAADGWSLVKADGFALGWGKITGGIVKNHLPKGLRRSMKKPVI